MELTMNTIILIIQGFFALVLLTILYQAAKAIFGNLFKTIYKSLKN